MASDVLTYSPADVKIIISGYVMTGVVSVTLNWKGTKPMRVVRGLNGQHTRVLNKDLYATVILEVLQTSISNDILTDILVQDRRKKSARMEFSVKDTRGNTMYHSTDAFVGAYPNIGLSSELQTRSWEIECLNFIDGGIGGNARQGFDVFDPVSGALDYLGGVAGGVVDGATDFVGGLF